MSSTHERSLLRPGWYLRLTGLKSDLALWRDRLHEFETTTVREAGFESWFFVSDAIIDLPDKEAVREQAYPIVDDLNVRMAMRHGTLPITILSIDEVGVLGGQNTFRMHSGPYDTYVRPKLETIKKSDFADHGEYARVSRLLVQFLLARSYLYSDIDTARVKIHDVLEVASQVVLKRKSNIRKLLGDRYKDFERLKSWANNPRHPLADHEVPEMRLDVAMALMADFVRLVVITPPGARIGSDSTKLKPDTISGG